MNLELLYVSGCPHALEAEERLRQALAVLGHTEVVIRHVVVDSVDEAEGRRFAGSPSVLVDGIDLFPTEQVGGITCRVYETEAGRQGTPTVRQLVEALRR